MEGNKRHPQFTLESDTKQTHFFVERTLLPRAPFARRGFIHIGKRQIKTRGFVETVLKSRKTFVVRRQKQSSIQTHFHSKLYGKYQLKAHTLIGIIYNARKNQDACRTNTTSAWVYASRIATFPLPYPSTPRTPRILRRMRRITRRIRIRWRALCESFFFSHFALVWNPFLGLSFCTEKFLSRECSSEHARWWWRRGSTHTHNAKVL